MRKSGSLALTTLIGINTAKMVSPVLVSAARVRLGIFRETFLSSGTEVMAMMMAMNKDGRKDAVNEVGSYNGQSDQGQK
jgi:hypothetical protein